ncbi:hypothetical protein AVEN_164894-1 [Araneus ventricosus]|uniref:Uncharacterized protein n=1 Tax=Araneus ventricosus TaxID=182803 RepID=A0A4Y2DV39_ARAVE|nr:hypothetical protein AVEN_164894-1 [Araneus ventricosus]
MSLDFVPADTGGIGPEHAHKTLESQFRFSLLTANDAFFIIEVLWVHIVISVNLSNDEDETLSITSSEITPRTKGKHLTLEARLKENQALIHGGPLVISRIVPEVL